MEHGVALLLEYPNIGRPRDDLQPGCRSYGVEQHTIYYIVRGRTLRILRILHNKMDARQAFRT